MRIPGIRRNEPRHGAATVEFAILLPLLMFLFGIGVDWARAFYYHITITNASRNAATWACQSPSQAADTASIQAMALQDCTSLGAGVTVQSSVITVNGVDYVKVTVSYAFQPVTGLPGTPSTQTIWQTTVMQIMPLAPQPGTF
jgi:Flp pilus assembly protein TadG